MLSRTADHLFWMARYMERAENTALMLDVNYQTALLPQSAAVAEQGWQGLLSISELTKDYTTRYGGINPRRAGIFACLKEMGADLTFASERLEAGENVADIIVRGNGTLKGIDVPLERVPSIQVKDVPEGVRLVAGMTATVEVVPRPVQQSK